MSQSNLKDCASVRFAVVLIDTHTDKVVGLLISDSSPRHAKCFCKHFNRHVGHAGQIGGQSQFQFSSGLIRLGNWTDVLFPSVQTEPKWNHFGKLSTISGVVRFGRFWKTMGKQAFSAGKRILREGR